MVNTADARLFFYCTDTQSYTIIMISSSGGHHVNHPLVMSSSCLVMSTCTSLFKNAPPFNTADEMLFFYRVERTHNHDDIIILL